MNSINQMKWFFQRGKRGCAECDFWDFNNYLIDIIMAGIEYLKNHSHGCPSEFYDETNINNECEKWIIVLDEILEGFKAGKRIINNDCLHLKERNGYYEQVFDEEEAKYLAKKFDRGMELFCKYFLELWD